MKASLACRYCGVPCASGTCNDCGAELYDDWRAEQAVAAHDAAVLAGEDDAATGYTDAF